MLISTPPLMSLNHHKAPTKNHHKVVILAYTLAAVTAVLAISGCNASTAATTPVAPALTPATATPVGYTYGTRPMYLVDDMDAGPLKNELKACEGQTAR